MPKILLSNQVFDLQDINRFKKVKLKENISEYETTKERIDELRKQLLAGEWMNLQDVVFTIPSAKEHEKYIKEYEDLFLEKVFKLGSVV